MNEFVDHKLRSLFQKNKKRLKTLFSGNLQGNKRILLFREKIDEDTMPVNVTWWEGGFLNESSNGKYQHEDHIDSSVLF